MVELLPPAVRRVDVADGFVLSSPVPLPTPAPTVLHWLDRWAAERPDTPFLAERAPGGGWRTVTYADTARVVPAVAGALAERGRGPVLLLSDNSVDHALVMLAALHLGVPAVPVSPAYSLGSASFRRLRHIHALLSPAAVFADDPARYRAALDLLAPTPTLDSTAVRAAAATSPIRARADIGPDTIAKVLFTSGSTGEPKGVVNTHRMLTTNQEGLRACWPFLGRTPPRVVDWLPWSHTFGGNHNFNLVLHNGGTLWIDHGRPVPGLLEVTLRNLAEIGPSIWFNVPRGFDQAVTALEREPELSARLFRDLDVIFYAAAALGATTRARLEALAAAAGRPDLFFTSAWGSTETSPLSTSAHFPTRTTGVLGVPIPGVDIKLARVDDRLEVRVRGPNVTPGYWLPGGGIAPAPLDADGFLPTGDAARLVDEARPEAGIAFAGRISENFKLSSGTWVNVGALRIAIVDACAPLVQDVVIAGHDREHLGILVLLSPAGIAGKVADDVRLDLYRAIEAFNRSHPASSERVSRALVLDRPLSLDDGETTDKGYTNQRRVLECRAGDVARLYADDPDVMGFEG